MDTKRQRLITIIFLHVMAVLRPLLGPEGICIFTPYTCTLYATDQLQNQPLHKALLRISGRLLRCNPINGLLKRFW